MTPQFRLFFTGRLISLLGSSMAPIALAFAVLDASHRPGDLGVVLAARMVPLLGFLLIGGAVADRFPRRTVLLVANLGAALTQGAVAAILLSGNYRLLAVAALEFANGTLDAFTGPALRGVVPELVAAASLRRANSLLAGARNATKIIGPSLAGVIVVTAGSGAAIAVDAASYLVAAGFLASLRLPAAAPAARSTLLADVRGGGKAFLAFRWVWLTSLTFCLVNLVSTGTWQILGPALTHASTWGLVLSARGAGLLAMSVLMYRLVIGHLLRFGQSMVILGALPLIALGLGASAWWLVAAGVAGGIGSAAAAISWDTSLQEHIPTAVLSRVSSYDDLLSYAAIPAGQLAVGPLAAAVGPHRVALTAGVGFALLALVPLASREVRALPHRG